jgi:hypothetical protein
MGLDEGLLRRAREAGSAAEAAQSKAELAKAEYHHAVRLLHLAGATMREIADALGISHQRVHQIIDLAGDGGWKPKKRAGADLVCTFCGLDKDRVSRLIAGPGVFICTDCVALVGAVAAQGTTVQTDRTRLECLPLPDRIGCSFCGAEAAGDTSMVTGPGVRICQSCVQLCQEIVAEELG